LSKMLPLSSEVMQHVERDDDQFQGMRNVTPGNPAPSFALPMADETAPAEEPDEIPMGE